MFESKYGVARHVYIPIIKRGVVDFAVGADWTPAAGDVKISKDGGAAANVTNLPTAIVMGNTAMWDFNLTAAEMQAAQIMVTVADASTKAVEDTMFIIETYGNASAQHAFDLGTALSSQTVGTATTLTNAPSDSSGTTTLLSRLSAGRATNLDNLDATVSSRLASASYTAPPSATTVAGAVWDMDATGHQTQGTFGQAIGDPGADTDTIFGLVNTNLDAAVSSRSTYAGGAVASVTGNVGGNVVGSVGSVSGNVGGNVTGSVGSVAAGGITASSFGAGAIDAAALATDAGQEIADRLLARSVAGGSDAARSVSSALRFIRNRKAIAAGTLTVYQEDDTTSAWTAAVTTAAGNPISEVDPA